MSTYSSKSVKSYSPIDSMSIVVLLVLIVTLLIAPFASEIYASINAALSNVRSAPASLSAQSDAVFGVDLQYWNANCSQGWSSDTTCDAIVARSQSCATGLDSAYCSEYNNYLQQFHK
jgi:hypothetical protein